jgi:hypothetical protein
LWSIHPECGNSRVYSVTPKEVLERSDPGPDQVLSYSFQEFDKHAWDVAKLDDTFSLIRCQRDGTDATSSPSTVRCDA